MEFKRISDAELVQVSEETNLLVEVNGEIKRTASTEHMKVEKLKNLITKFGENSEDVQSVDEALDRLCACEIGGVSSWNDLTDKPFYANEVILAEWNGNVDNFEIAGDFVRLSETPITPEDLDKYTVYVTDVEGFKIEDSGEHFEKDGMIIYNLTGLMSVYDVVEGSLPASLGMGRGLWLETAHAPYIAKITSVECKTIQPECLPVATDKERGVLSKFEIADTVYSLDEVIHISDSMKYVELAPYCMNQPPVFRRVSYNGVSYFVYCSGNYGFDGQYFLTLNCIDRENCVLKNIKLTFDSNADDATPISIEVTP